MFRRAMLQSVSSAVFYLQKSQQLVDSEPRFAFSKFHPFLGLDQSTKDAFQKSSNHIINGTGGKM